MLNRLKKYAVRTIIVLVVLIIGVVGAIMISPRPMVWLSKILMFDRAPNKGYLPNYDELFESVTISRDYEYPSEFGQNQYDVYKPKNSTGDEPLLVWVHGGGFVGGFKEMLENYLVSVASQGYVVVAMNYGLAPKYQYPTPVIQVNEFVKHIHTKSDSYGFDETQVFFAGDSAGAQIVSQYLLTQTTAGYGDTIGIDMSIPQASIRGVLLYCGPYRLDDLLGSSVQLVNLIFSHIGWSYLGEKNWVGSDRALEASVVDHVSSNFPPAYITDGNTASFEPSARALLEKLDMLNVETKSRFYDITQFTTNHEYQFIMDNEPGITTFNDTIEFLAQYRKNGE